MYVTGSEPLDDDWKSDPTKAPAIWLLEAARWMVLENGVGVVESGDLNEANGTQTSIRKMIRTKPNRRGECHDRRLESTGGV